MARPQNTQYAYNAPGASHYGNPPSRNVYTGDMPQFTATFVPSGMDDYYMPELVAPSPQRVMPEVPHNMQEGLQRLELEAQPGPRAAPANYGVSSDPYTPRQVPQAPQQAAAASGYNNSAYSSAYSASAFENTAASDDFKPFSQGGHGEMDAYDAPTFSPFPRVKGDNVPPTDEEKEEILYNARQHVLNSNNVSMQLVWARDSLTWVEAAAEAHMRENKGQAMRPTTPKTEHELRVDAINIVSYLSSQDHPEALFIRSKWLEFGRFGFRPDKKEAYLGYKKAAEQGWGRAEYRMGMLFEGSNEMDKALLHYNNGLALKDSAASYRLGMMSLLGQHGYPKDFQNGIDLIQAAADTSDDDAPQGAYVFGMLISRELPDITIPEHLLPVNFNLARQYIEKAAYLGFAKAQLKMGQAYELCQLGCDFNPALSLHYYGLAARQGQPEAALGVSRWFLFGYEDVFQKNEQLAFRYAQQAADAKLATGEFAMGYYYEIGIHVPKDLQEARVWYERAAEHGNKDASSRILGLDQAKTLTKQDHETTALTRIKSKHGSMRGQRPERFSSRQPPPSSLPALSETPDIIPPPKRSPNAVGQPGQVPAFSLNIDQGHANTRSKSAAPYPDDDRPAPLNLARPRSTAPYPDDDVSMRPMPSPHYNPQIRQSAGAVQANRPVSAFSIQPANANGQQGQGFGPGPRQFPMSQSTGSLGPEPRPHSAMAVGGRPMAGGRTASAGWDPQVPAGYKGDNRMQGDGRGRLTKPHNSPPPNMQQPPQQPLQPLQPLQSLQSQPAQQPLQPQGYGYGPRTSSRPAPAGGRVDSMPVVMQGSSGRQSVPAVQSVPTSGPAAARPSSAMPQRVPVGTMSSTQTQRPAAAKPAAKPAPSKASTGQGPATFEEMGIPQGKSNDDCIIM